MQAGRLQVLRSGPNTNREFSQLNLQYQLNCYGQRTYFEACQDFNGKEAVVALTWSTTSFTRVLPCNYVQKAVINSCQTKPKTIGTI